MNKNLILILLSVVMILSAGCALFGPKPPQQNQLVPVAGTLCDQQLAAYPQLDENPYLVLKDFESPDQIGDFCLSRSGKPVEASNVFAGREPAATGNGALGATFGPEGEYTLTFNTPIRRWKEYNLLILAMFSQEDQLTCGLGIADSRGKTFKTTLLLRKSWNPLQVDLKSAGKVIDLNQVAKLVFTFNRIGNTRIFLDDLILVDYHKNLLGRVDGPAGSLFAFQNGKEIHVGSNRRFELVFSEGKLTGWYDLETEGRRPEGKGKSKNLLGPGRAGLEIFQIPENNRLERTPANNELVNAHTCLTARGNKSVTLKIENYFGDIPADRPNQTYIYQIFPDGLIRVEIRTPAKTNRLGIGLSVDPNQGFEAVVGKLRNPAGGGQNRIEYVLFRRVGKNAGADLVMMFKPWKLDFLPVQCRLNVKGSQAVLVSDAVIGENTLHGLIRLWPTNIDHLGNAEIHVRTFLETP